MGLPFYMTRDDDCPIFLADRDTPICASELQPIHDPIDDVRHNLAVAQIALRDAVKSAEEALSVGGCTRTGAAILNDVIRFQSEVKGRLVDMESDIAEAQNESNSKRN